MTDQDLIAEGREVLTACAILRADDELTRWAKNHLPAVLADLERARRRIAELERSLRDEGASAGRLADQLRASCTQGADAAARVAELEARVGRLTEWHEQTVAALREARAYAELEAAQRPPLGYMVLEKRNATTYSIVSRIQPARASAEYLRERRIAEQLAMDPPTRKKADPFIAEVREVQP